MCCDSLMTFETNPFVSLRELKSEKEIHVLAQAQNSLSLQRDVISKVGKYFIN